MPSSVSNFLTVSKIAARSLAISMSSVPALNGDASPFWIALTMTPTALDAPIVIAAKRL